MFIVIKTHAPSIVNYIEYINFAFNKKKMSKNDYNRYSLKNNFMKQVLFRLDYKGVLDTKAIVSAFKDKYRSKFNTLETVYNNQVDFELSNINDISETLSIPVKEIVKQEIYRFSDNTFGKDEVILDISKYFTTLIIQCKDYDTIDEYKKLFTQFVELLYSVEDYISIKRFGLRKIGGQISTDFKDVTDDFEQEHFNLKFTNNGYSSKKNNYIDILDNGEELSPIINLRRSFEKGKLLDENNNQVDAFQVILDFDGYFDEQKLNSSDFANSKDISKIVEQTNNSLFEIFKMSVTESFLKKNKK